MLNFRKCRATSTKWSQLSLLQVYLQGNRIRNFICKNSVTYSLCPLRWMLLTWNRYASLKISFQEYLNKKDHGAVRSELWLKAMAEMLGNLEVNGSFCFTLLNLTHYSNLMRISKIQPSFQLRKLKISLLRPNERWTIWSTIMISDYRWCWEEFLKDPTFVIVAGSRAV